MSLVAQRLVVANGELTEIICLVLGEMLNLNLKDLILVSTLVLGMNYLRNILIPNVYFLP